MLWTDFNKHKCCYEVGTIFRKVKRTVFPQVSYILHVSHYFLQADAINPT